MLDCCDDAPAPERLKHYQSILDVFLNHLIVRFLLAERLRLVDSSLNAELTPVSPVVVGHELRAHRQRRGDLHHFDNIEDHLGHVFVN